MTSTSGLAPLIRAGQAALAVLLLVTCSTDSPIGLDRPGLAAVRVRPKFDASARLAPLTLDRVRVIVVRPPTEILADISRGFDANATQVQVDAPVLLNDVSEDLQVTVELYAGSQLLFRGTRTITVTAGSSTAPAEIPVDYAGPGSTLTTLALAPLDTSVTPGATFTFRISARNGQGADVPEFYVGWSASGGSITPAGSFTAPQTPGPVTITATAPKTALLPAGLTAQTTVQVIPAPAGLGMTSGDGQSGLTGAALEQPLVVRVTGLGDVPVSGALVSFAATVGGGSVTPASATTDARGEARTVATLGPAPGSNRFTASVGDLAVTFTATGLAVRSGPLAAGGRHSCEIRGAATYCWGANSYGQLGDGTTTDRLVATTVGGGQVFVAVTAGDYWHSCALTPAGRAYCWGANNSGELGDGNGGSASALPVAVSGNHLFTQVSAGDEFTCALDAGGAAWCWGSNGNGRLGDGSGFNSAVPVPVAGGQHFVRISSAGEWDGSSGHSCAITAAGVAWCWGTNVAGELGDGTQAPSPVPVPVTGGLSFSDISVGQRSTCAIATSGAGYCWGYIFGANLTSPQQVAGGLHYTAIDMGGNHVCGLTTALGWVCGGNNSSGQLGDGSGADQQTPVVPAGGHVFTTVAAGLNHSCGVTAAQGSFCWGADDGGQLGTGDALLSGSLTPVAVVGPAVSVSVSAGDGQQAAPGASVAVAPAVLVRDELNNPIPGVEVTFTVSGGGGSLSSLGATEVQLTNGSGIATVSGWILGPSVGANNLTATVAGNPIGFTATGQIASSAALAYSSAGYRYSTDAAQTGWWDPAFSDAAWSVGAAPFASGSYGGCTIYSTAQTAWNTTDLLARHSFTVPTGYTGGATVSVAIDNDIQVFVNGHDITSTAQGAPVSGGFARRGGCAAQGNILFNVVDGALNPGGTNVIAIHAVDGGPPSFLDVEVTLGGLAGSGTSWLGRSSNWNDQNNWSTGVVPSASDSVNIVAATFQPILTGPTAIGAIAISGGSLTLNGQGLTVARTFATTGTGTVTMADGDALLVGGQASFAGGSEQGLLSGGVLTVNGNFTQAGNPASFQASGTHQTVLTGAASTVRFAAPGGAAGSSHFQELAWIGDGVLTLGTDVVVLGGFTTSSTAAARIARLGATPQRLTIGEFAHAAPLTFDGVPLVLQQPAAVAMDLDGLTFQNQPLTGTQLTVNHPGLATGLSFSNLSFLTTPTTGFYLAATDLAPTDGQVLTINVTSATPSDPGTLVQRAGGAVVNWPVVTLGRAWTGAISTDWSTPGNWSPVGAPTSLNDVTIGPVTRQPTLTANSVANSVTIAGAGARLTIGGRSLTLGTALVTHTDGLLVMTNPADLVIVGGDAAFQGGNQTGLLSAGELRVAGAFTQQEQTDARSFFASGTHRVVFNGPTLQSVRFCCTVGGSGFRELDLSNTAGINIQNTGNLVVVFDTLIVQPGAGPTPLLYTLGSSLTAARFRVSKLIVDRGTLALNEGGVAANQQLDNVTFQNYLTSQTQLALTAAGGAAAPRTLTFNNLTFQPLTTGDAGRYLSATAPTGPLVVNLPGATPAGGNGPAFTLTSGAVTVNWPATPVITWTGAVSADWSVAGNWSTGGVPGASDSAVIVGAATLPRLNGPTSIGAVEIKSGSVALNGQTLAIARTLTTTGTGVITMTSALDLVTVGGTARFNGGSTSGLLTSGTLQIAGSFTQLAGTSLNSFAADAGHTTRLTGANPVVSFATPGPALSHFGTLRQGSLGTPMLLTSNVAVTGNLTGSEGFGGTISGPCGDTLTVQGRVESSGITFDCIVLVVDDVNATGDRLGPVTFINQGPSWTQLTIRHPGLSSSSYSLTGITFTALSAGSTGLYLDVLDSDGPSPYPLRLDVVGVDPGNGAQFTRAGGGAIVGWGTSTAFWTGTPSGNFGDPLNWSSFAVPGPTTNVIVPAGTNFVPTLDAARTINDLTVESGAAVNLLTSSLTLSGSLTSDGDIVSFNSGNLILQGSGKSLRGQVDVNTDVRGVYTLGGNLVLGANFSRLSLGISGSLDLDGHTANVIGSFATTGGGVLRMTNPGDTLIATGMHFDGGDETGKLTNGVMLDGGDFTQSSTGSAASFVAQGTHRTAFFGVGPKTISFANPTTSRFNILDVSNGPGEISLASNVEAAGQLVCVTAGNAPPISGAGAGVTLTAAGANVTRLTIAGVPLILDGGTITAFSNVTFSNQSPAGTALTIWNTGAGGPFAFDNLRFDTQLSGGFHLAANDLDGAGVNGALTLDITNSSPSSGTGVSQALNGAVVNWPPAPAFLRTWTGLTSVSWTDPANWIPALVPTSSDSVVIRAGTPFAPTLSSAGAARDLEVATGATLTLSQALTVSGSVSAPGTIADTGTLILSGTGKTVLGHLGHLSVSGSYALADSVTVSDSTSVLLINGSLRVNGRTLVTTSTLRTSAGGTLVMQNPADTVLLVRGGIFGGGAETGLLTAGTLIVRGSFVQGDPQGTSSSASFVATGNHKTVLVGPVPPPRFVGPGPQQITFLTPNPSRFQNLEILSSSGTSWQSDAWVLGAFTFGPGASKVLGSTLAASPTLRLANVALDGVTFSNLALEFDWTLGGKLTQLDNTTFQKQSGTVTQLSVLHPGGTAPLYLNNLVFSTPPTSGFYLSASDDAPQDGQGLVINLLNPTPATPGNFLRQLNGAVVNWSLGPLTYTGPAAGSWFTGANWDQGRVPTRYDQVIIPGNRGGIGPSISSGAQAAEVMDLTVQAGAALSNFGTLNIYGALDMSGSYTGGQGFSLYGEGRAIRGTVGGLSTYVINVYGSYQLAGNLTTTPELRIQNAAGTTNIPSLDLNGFTADVVTLTTAGNGILRMTNDADILLVGGSANFGGGSTYGELTAGMIRILGGGNVLNQTAANSVNSFAPTGTHRPAFAANTGQVITFASPGTLGSGSHFQILDLTGAAGNGAATIRQNTFVDSTLIANAAAAAPQLFGTGFSLTARQWQVNGLAVNNARMILDERGARLPQLFNGVSFTGFPATNALLMDVTAVGDVGNGEIMSFNNLVLPTLAVGAGNLYVRLKSSTLSVPGTQIQMINSTQPTLGPTLSDPPNQQLVNGAIILWQTP